MPTKISINCTCPFCNTSNNVTVYHSDYFAWKRGTNAQDAFPYLSADAREMLISGICPTCWEDLFGRDA